jgi:hypothetical protein
MKPHRNMKVVARFSPRITDDLDPALLELVGAEAVFTYHRFVDEEDTPYMDQWVLTTEDRRFGGFWFPESDLEILRESLTA